MHEHSDEELLGAIAAGPGFLPEFYRRHVVKVAGVGVRRFSTPEDVADFVANVFLEVLRSAGGCDPRRGDAVAWLYGLAGNVAAGPAARLRGHATAARPGPAAAGAGRRGRAEHGGGRQGVRVTAVATRVRLVRARARLRALMPATDQPLPAGPTFVKEERA